MWLLTGFFAEAAGSGWQQYLVPGALALLATVGAAWLALRGTFKTAAVTHEAEFDKLVHARVAKLEDQLVDAERRLETMTADRDRYRELHAQLRLDVIAAGLHPDRLGRGGPSDA